MKEIERKIFDIDTKAVSLKLLKMGAKILFKGIVRVKYFDTKKGDIRKKHNLLRVRQLGEKRVEVCFKCNKRVKDGCKIYDECEFFAYDFDRVSRFFEKLGYVCTCYYEKKRTEFNLKNIKIEMDEYPRIKPFIEIEASSVKKINDLINELGLEKNEASSETINEVLKRKYPKISLNNLTFKKSK
ncbi:CYTH domain-containing protein [Candidatus Peregrinibacteria bacterium]|nr:CYTH domain-containing protein [Candidatus Peregrinibacteria bacterium]